MVDTWTIDLLHPDLGSALEFVDFSELGDPPGTNLLGAYVPGNNPPETAYIEASDQTTARVVQIQFQPTPCIITTVDATVSWDGGSSDTDGLWFSSLGNYINLLTVNGSGETNVSAVLNLDCSTGVQMGGSLASGNYLHYTKFKISGIGTPPLFYSTDNDNPYGFCPVTDYNQETDSDPIVLRTGEKLETATDLSLNTPAGKLAFTRNFRQSKLDTFTNQLGMGWWHNHIYEIDDSVTNKLLVTIPGGGILHFNEESTNNYVADAGSTATLDTSGTGASKYTLSTTDRSTFVFDDTGRLRSQNWPNGETWTYTYYADTHFTGGKLQSVGDDYGRSLEFVYIDNVGQFNHQQLWRVGDHNTTSLDDTAPSGRYVEFSYTEGKEDNGGIVANGLPLLTSVRDVLGNIWTYDYETAQSAYLNYLIRVTSPEVDVDGGGSNPSNEKIVLKELMYNSTNGVLQSQKRGKLSTASSFLLEKSYAFTNLSDGNTTVETVAGRDTIHYFASDVYFGSSDPAGNSRSRGLNSNFRHAGQADGNGNATGLTWSDDGKTLDTVTDALDNQTSFTYDSEDRLTHATDAQGHITQYTYGDTNVPRQPTLIRWLDSDGSTVLRRQEFTYDSKGRVTSEKLIDPTDETTVMQETTRVFGTSGNSNGLLTSITQKDMQTSDDQTTSYTYDSAGRIIKAYKSSLMGSCQATYTVYDAAGLILGTACSLENVMPPTDIASLLALYDGTDATKKQTRVTLHEYDALGRKVATTMNAGSSFAYTTRTIYDSLSRVTRTISRYVAQGSSAPGDWEWDEAQNRWEDGAGNPISHGLENNQNIINDTAYNARGLMNLRRDTLGRTTLSGYDMADRLVKTVRNASTATYDMSYATGNPDLSAYVASSNVDEDVITEQFYDAAGNVVESIDARGSKTITIYDALNRPIKVIANAKAGATVMLDDGDVGYADTNDPRSTNYVVSTHPDRDHITETDYDSLGRMVGTRRLRDTNDWDEMVYVYDSLGRQVRTVQHYVEQGTSDLAAWVYESGQWKQATGGTAIVQDSDAGAGQINDQNIISETFYDDQGRTLETVDVNRRRTRMVYDGLSRQVMTIANYVEQGSPASDPADWVWSTTNDQWEYSLGNAVSHGANFDQNIISFTEYDGDGRVFETRNLEGLVNHTAYDAQGRTYLSVQNFAGGTPANWLWDNADTRWEDGSNNPVARSTAFDQNMISQPEYDDENRVFQTRDVRGNLTRSVFDEQGRQVMTIANYVPTSPASDPADWVWSTSDSRWEDGAGNLISHSTDNDQNRISHTIYDLIGRVASTRDTVGRQMVYRYDGLDRRVVSVSNYVAQATDPAEWVWREVSGVSAWRLSQTNDGTVGLGANLDANHISQTVYNAQQQVANTRDARGTQSSFIYDEAGRRLQVERATGTSLATRDYTVYDKAGRVLKRIANYAEQGTPATDPAAWVFEGGFWKRESAGTFIDHANDDMNIITEMIYDNANRQVSVRNPEGDVSQTRYFLDGQVDTMTDPENVVTAYRYDELRRRVLVVQNYVVQGSSDPADWVFESGNWKQAPSGTNIAHGTENDQNIIVQLTHDVAGRMATMRDPRGNVTSYQYDQLGRRSKLTNPLNEEWLTRYEDAGQAQKTIMTYPGLATGGTYDVTRTMDRMGRLAAIDYGAAATTPTVTFGYDITGNRLSMTENDGTADVRVTEYGYDNANRLNSVGFDTDGDGNIDETVSYRYDQGGLRTHLTIPGNLQITYTYDEKGRLVGLNDLDNGQTDYTYDAVNRHVGTQRPNNVDTTYAYDLAGRIANLKHQEDGASLPLLDYTYAVDGRGNRTQVIEKVLNGGTQDTTTIDYTYDGLARLIQADYSVGSDYTYAYDLAGNMVNMNGTTRTYNAANQMTTDGINTLTYDANGNLTNDGTNAYTWDRANRMLSRGANNSYAYDGLGNRVQQTVSSVVTDYLLDLQPGLAKVLRESDGTNTTYFTHGPRGIQAQHIPSTPSTPATWGNVSWGHFNWGDTGAAANVVQYHLQDGLGSVRGVVDNNAVLSGLVVYDPYGTPDVSVDNFGFTGEYTDPTGQLYLWARYYNPSMGTFTALDPAETRNRYAYVSGNPINRRDPSGLFDESTCTIEYGDYLERIAIQVGVRLDSGQYISDIPNPSLAQRRQAWQKIAAVNPQINPSALSPGQRLRAMPANARNLTCGQRPGVVDNPPVGSGILPKSDCGEPRMPIQDWPPVGNGIIQPDGIGGIGPGGLLFRFDLVEYPQDCTNKTPEECALYHLTFLAGTPSIQFLRDRNIYKPGLGLAYNLQLFASFVAPDSWNSHPLGTPADIKEHYLEEYGRCVSYFDQDYGFDLMGNISFGYIGRVAGYSEGVLRLGAGVAQMLDTFTGGGGFVAATWSTFGDAPEDEVGTRMGSALYDKCGQNCSINDLESVLNQFRAEYVSTLSSGSACSG